MGFYGEGIVKRALLQGEKNFLLKEIVEEGDIIPKEDLKKSFTSGFLAVRNYFRKNTKPSSLAMQYGGSAQTLQNNFKVAKATSIRMYVNFFKKLHVTKKHLEGRVQTAMKKGYVETLFGRRLFLPMLKNRRTKNAGIRKIYNSPIQGTASSLLKIGLLKMNNWVEKYQLSRYQGNNLPKLHRGELYHRIVLVDKKHLKALSKEDFPNGHTKILVTNSKGKVIHESEKAIKLDYYRFKKYNMKIFS
jgi:hypothetical protein